MRLFRFEQHATQLWKILTICAGARASDSFLCRQKRC